MHDFMKNSEIKILMERNKKAQNLYGSSQVDGIDIQCYVEETITRSLKVHYFEGACIGYCVLGLHNCNIGLEEEALQYIQLCESYIKKYNLNEINYLCLYNAYTVYYCDVIGDKEKAALYCKLGIEKATALDDKSMLMRLKGNLAVLHLANKNYHTGIELLKDILVYHESKNDILDSMYCYNNLGYTYLKLDLIDKSRDNFQKAYNSAVALGDIAILSDSSIGLSQIYGKQGQYLKAVALLEETLQYEKKEKAIRPQLDIIFELIDIYISIEDLDKAESLLINNEVVINNINNNLVSLQFYERKAKIAEGLENFKEAYYSGVKCKEITKVLEKANGKSIINNLLNIQLKKTRDRLDTIFKIGRELTTMGLMDDILLEVSQKLQTLMHVDFIGIGEIIDDFIVYNHCYQDNQKVPSSKTSLKNKTSFSVWSVANKKEIMLNDISNEYFLYVDEINEINFFINSTPTQSLFFAPLIVKDEIIGVFTIQSYKKNAYSSEEFEIFKIISSYIAIAQVNTKQAEKLKNLSLIDTLTNLNNRSGFTFGYATFACNNSSNIKSTSIIMLDLDYFKLINDTFGHMAGDLVLKKIGKILNGYADKVDLIARIGGEEFAILIINKNKDSIKIIAEDIRKAFESTEIIYKNKPIKISTSMGISYIEKDKLPLFEDLYYQADKALYKAKSLGRNRVEFFKD
ncbi:tetratricopeptide repeat-containing diguanylate cyclase [Clostridium grantii]|uniref:Diguanylate cyclase (GGDEF) domain-containing protein n=1 Tax=Clostridium grantii DSM 8605 TaxID=1121316 RepID=A0A1M5VBN7_9CLOT|nr:diguanylate cyclase [Clostridium grantii]SHH72637.1 diguanylate cyclase (GGDEF) domain-containing protein [Clostridium grantii DSM 8605]